MHRRDLLKLSALLLGSAATTSVSRAIQAGVNTNSTLSAAFSDDQRLAVSLLSDMIIPRTDTPGAVEAGVPAFIESIVADWYTETERGIFMQGLNDLDDYCLAHASARFTTASDDIRIAALRDQEAIAREYQSPMGAAGPSLFGAQDDQLTPFFSKIRELVVLGYYTSEVGATQELIYRPMVHEFDGDHDFSKVGRQLAY